MKKQIFQQQKVTRNLIFFFFASESVNYAKFN